MWSALHRLLCFSSCLLDGDIILGGLIWKVEPAGRSGSLEDGPWFPFHPSLFFLTLPCYKESQQQVPGIMTRIPATISPCLPHHCGWYHLKLWAKKNLYPYNCFLSGIWSQWQIPAPEFIIDINQNSNFWLSNTKAMLTGAHWPIVHDAMRWYSDLRHEIIINGSSFCAVTHTSRAGTQSYLGHATFS